MSVPFWVDGIDPNANTWDYVWLGDQLLPGILKEFKIDSKNTLDVGKAQGNTGAPVTPKGRQPRTISITVQVIKQSEWDDWDATLKALNMQGSDTTQRAFSITHPLAAKFGVTSVYIETLSLPMPSPVNGITFSLSCTENIPAKPVSAAAASKKPGSTTSFGTAGFPVPKSQVG
jgi:hypothetical protein